MTRTRKSTGRIAFVGAGPGDPGLLTRRAYDALLSADHVVHDRNVPDALLGVIRAEVEEDTQFSPAEGAPGDVAKVLLSAARSGLSRRAPGRRRPARPRIRAQGGPGGRADRRAVRGRAGHRAGGRRRDLRRRAAAWRPGDRRHRRPAGDRLRRDRRRRAARLVGGRGRRRRAGHRPRRAAGSAGVDPGTPVVGDRRWDRRDPVQLDLDGRQHGLRRPRVRRADRAVPRGRASPSARSSAGGRTGRCTGGRCSYRAPRSRPAR